MSIYTENQLVAARNLCFSNRVVIEQSKSCGCFHCCTIFPATFVKRWKSECNRDESACCPACGTDSLIGDATDIALNMNLLTALNAKYFDGACAAEDAEVIAAITARFEQLDKENQKKP